MTEMPDDPNRAHYCCRTTNIGGEYNSCGEYRATCRHSVGPFFGRLLGSIIFIFAGIGKVFFFRSTVANLQSYGIQGAEFLVVIALLLEIVGGILILLGWYTHIGVYLLMIFLLPTTLIYHAFWNYTGQEMQDQLANFLKNVSIYGGLLILLSYGPGRWSLDACRAKV